MPFRHRERIDPGKRQVDTWFQVNAFVPSYSDSVLALSPTAYWKLDESSGTNAADSSGNGYNGTYINTPTLGSTGLVTGGGTSVTFAGGSSQRVSFSHDATLDTDGHYTIAFWFKSNSGGSMHPFAYNDSGWNNYLSPQMGGAQMLWVSAGGGAFDVQGGTATINDNARHFCFATADQTTGKIYIDGTLDNTVSLTAGTMTSWGANSLLELAARQNQFASGFEEFYTGVLGHVAYWKSYVGTATDATNLWNAGK